MTVRQWLFGYVVNEATRLHTSVKNRCGTFEDFNLLDIRSLMFAAVTCVNAKPVAIDDLVVKETANHELVGEVTKRRPGLVDTTYVRHGLFDSGDLLVLENLLRHHLNRERHFENRSIRFGGDRVAITA